MMLSANPLPTVMNTANNTNNNQNNEQKDDDNTEKEKKKKKMGIRYAEKRRTSTCQFADRVARISIDHYNDKVPKKYQLPQTCLATIVAHNSQTGELQVLSMGVGTKFLSESVLNEEVKSSSLSSLTTTKTTTYGQRIRDCHAEVLARRGFCRFLCLEILDLLLLLKSSTATNSTDNHDHHHDNENENENDDVDQDQDNGKRNFINKRGQILERTTTTNNNNNINNKNKNKLQFKLQSTISLHLYTSSAPCGNAVLKKFSKMKKEIYRDDLGPNEWPMMLPMMMMENDLQKQKQQHEKHEPILGHSIHLGQFMLLVKKDNSINADVVVSAAAAAAASASASATDDDEKRHDDDNPSKMTTTASPSASKTAIATATAASVASVSEINPKKKKTKKRKKVWPAHESDDWTPPGTTTATTNKGSIHTCSDKICRWNYLGLQGSLLATFMENPIYMSTITVGRKLTECICRRAVCCRLGENFDHQQFASSLKTTTATTTEATTTTSTTAAATPPPTTNCDTNDIDSCSLLGGARDYRINHPAILGTAVYMDEFGAVETKSDIVGQDVRFHSTLSWAWWRTSNSGHHNNSHNDNYYNNNQLECIDGRTGYLANLDLDDDDAFEGNDETISEPPTPSLLCTWNLTRLFMEARSIIDDKQGQNDDNPEYYSSLSSLCELKREVSPYHEKTKDILMTKHKVLRDWNRRSKKNWVDDDVMNKLK